MTDHALITNVVPFIRDHWWLRLGVEIPRPVHRCAAPDCALAQIAPTDVYCHTHETFLPWGPRKPRWYHYALIALVRTAIAAGFFCTALWNTMLPVWGIAVMSGLAIAVVPLRHYRLTATFAALYWLVAAAFGFELWHSHLSTQYQLITGSAYLGLAAWCGFMALLANAGGGGRAGEAGTDRGGQVVALTMTITLPALAAAAVRPEWRELSLILAISGAVGAILIAAIIGVLRGGRRPDAPTPPQLPYPHRPRALRWRLPINPPRSQQALGPIDRLAHGFLLFARAVLALTVAGSGKTLTAARFTGFAVVLAATAVFNWLLWISMEASLRILWSIVAASLVYWSGLRIMWAALLRSLRVLVAPLGLAACAAVTVTWWSEAVRQYLIDGGTATLAWIGAGLLAAVAALTMTWVALSGQPLATSLRSAKHSINLAATKGLLVLAGFAWLLGLPGTFFDGPIQLGGLTFGVTILIVVALLIHFAARLHHRKSVAGKGSRNPATDRPDSSQDLQRRPEAAREVSI